MYVYLYSLQFLPRGYRRETVVDLICDIDLIGEDECHGFKGYWFVLAERALAVCLRVCQRVRVGAREPARIRHVVLIYIILPLYTGIYI